MYTIQKNVNRFYNMGSTYFLDPRELSEIKGKLGKEQYSIYYPYKDSEKCIVYQKVLPEVLLYEIKTKIDIRHQDILGVLFSLDISKDLFGDIIIIDNHYYIFVLPIIRNYLEANFLEIKNSRIELENLNIDFLANYERKYQYIELLVSSLRIDTVISVLAKIRRSQISEMIRKKEIILNYAFLKKADYKLKEGDVFSIKRIGKYKFDKIIKTTNKNRFIIAVRKYN